MPPIKTYLTGAYPLPFDGKTARSRGIMVGHADAGPADRLHPIPATDKVNAVPLEDVRRGRGDALTTPRHSSSSGRRTAPGPFCRRTDSALLRIAPCMPRPCGMDGSDPYISSGFPANPPASTGGCPIRIAAGEVIERPASAGEGNRREALDACARRITSTSRAAARPPYQGEAMAPGHPPKTTFRWRFRGTPPRNRRLGSSRTSGHSARGEALRPLRLFVSAALDRDPLKFTASGSIALQERPFHSCRPVAASRGTIGRSAISSGLRAV